MCRNIIEMRMPDRYSGGINQVFLVVFDVPCAICVKALVGLFVGLVLLLLVVFV